MVAELQPRYTTRHTVGLDGLDVGGGLTARHIQHAIRNGVGWYNRATGLIEPAVSIQQDACKILYLPKPSVEDSVTPPEWGDDFKPRYRVSRGRAEIYAYDSAATDGNPCVAGIGHDSSPHRWLNIKLHGAAPSGHEVFPSEKAIRFDDPYDGVSAFWWQASWRGIKGLFECDPTVWGGSVDYWLKMPELFTFHGDGVGGAVIRENGVDRMSLPAPYAWDSENGDRRGLFVDGVPIAVEAVPVNQFTNDGYRFVRVRYTVAPADLAAAVGMLRVDPTATIGGSGDPSAIEGAFINGVGVNVNTNYGNSVAYAVGRPNAANLFRFLVRWQASALPAETITAGRLLLYQYSTGDANGNTVDVFAVADGNTWAEGPGGASIDMTWNDRDNPTDWLGGSGSGCGVSITDHDAVAESSFSYSNVAVDTLHTTAIGAALLTAHKAATRTADGVVIIARDEVTTLARANFRSDDAGANEPALEIDYTTGPSIAVVHNYNHMVGGLA